MKKMGTLTIGAAAAALLAGSVFTTPASAAPAAAAAAMEGVSKSASTNIEQVRSRGGWRGHRHRHGGWGWGAGAVGAGLLLSAPLWAGGYDDGYDDDGYDGDYAYNGGGGEARCAATFRSFDPDSGTYMGYDGIRRTCPYL